MLMLVMSSVVLLASITLVSYDFMMMRLWRVLYGRLEVEMGNDGQDDGGRFGLAVVWMGHMSLMAYMASCLDQHGDGA